MVEKNEEIEQTFQITSPELEVAILGIQDKFVSLYEQGMNVTINPFGDNIKIKGLPENVKLTADVLHALVNLTEQGIWIHSTDIVSAMKMAHRGTLDYFADLYSETIIRDRRGRSIRVKNFGQRQYVNAIKHNDITFGIGPAGTGKTYLAVAMAVAALKRGEVERIILTRPAVEAGESLGFLPGDLQEKIDPYLRPIYDALNDIFGTDHTQRLMERGVIEIAPLAYMRGRTLDGAFVILDEAQNTTNAQMKMFLTRLGFGSKMVVNGDVSQIDLPHGTRSGLISAERILKDIKSIKFVQFTAEDVVRHPVVARIINAYETNATKRLIKRDEEREAATKKAAEKKD
ncbi:PhoH family protein [Limosilactobacillus fastidiosus]|uniref:PhoH-like protein n=1 Tax=Limosilactobacillus fastidiosus TaxID=2759855 RepID=A0A7W3U051_9LACO|nr:PhoH family protein [Limosilactobacillus fastidiosus]MBB1086481.1 PhoH family protein [Limosilactobacillus fastidiosus]MCD7085167.1 PhoH family protein [Limosilactobacillus fastidiosus]MCD7115069.1 PhoH family protein [Limosilactobacillus fastidiosus]MCD7116247.1 PhoH family protein [Limosilactobacillus fastidiosus]